VVDEQGRRFAPVVHGRQRNDGLWEGWLEFDAHDAVLQTDRETTQSTLADLSYWASGLETTYLEGAFRRAHP
jgi:hypothetical protein